MTASTWSAASPANSTDAEARRAVEEYRRFAFLCCVADQELTPSLLVDEFWHLHLLHTRDYWQHWCPKVLRRPLHHGPTRGRPADNARYRRQYAATLALYEQHLGTPPATAWPGTRERFAANARIRRIDLARPIVLPRPTGLPQRPWAWPPSRSSPC